MNNAGSGIKVSIIITCYNLEHFIADAINSLLNQQCEFPFELIIIDDASTDSSPEIIRSIRSDRIQFIPLTENVGAARAINICYEKTKGEYICRFDGDDKWYPDYLQKAADILDNNSEVVLVHSDVTFIDEHNNITSERNNILRPYTLATISCEFEYILQKYYINAPAIMARRTAWGKVLPWKDEFRQGLGDWYCTLGMLEGNYSYYINEPLAYYRIHSTNMHRAMISNGAAEKNTNFILEHFRNRKNGISQIAWRIIYFEQNKHLGFAYFYHNMPKASIRCLWKALKLKPAAFFDASFMRIFLADIIGKNIYTDIKRVFLKRK